MSLEETYAEMRQALSEVKECQAHLLGACNPNLPPLTRG